jgi:uncharacterized protein
MFYAWDPAKVAANLRKHRVAFPEAASVFLDPLANTYPDPDHSLDEPRYLTIGVSALERVVLVAHSELVDDRIRIISARKATKREAHAYNEEN